MNEWMERLGMDPSFGERHLNQGFSGGERRRGTRYCSSPCSSPAWRCWTRRTRVWTWTRSVWWAGAYALSSRSPDMGVVVVTHYERLLEDLVPDQVHLLVGGRVVTSGGAQLAARVEPGAMTSGGPMSVRADRTDRDPASARRGSDDPIDVEAVRKDFPLLTRRSATPIVYLDSAATALAPRSVLSAIDPYYETTHANVHRGVYLTAEESTCLYEGTRTKVGRFIGAPTPHTRSCSPRTPPSR